MVTAGALGESDIFKGLPAKTLHDLAGLCTEETYRTGESIIAEGAQASTLYVLLQGLVSLRISPAEGRELTVGLIGSRGETFGWSALVEPRRYTASAICLEDGKVIAIPGAQLLSYLEKEPEIGFLVTRRLAGIISSRLQETRYHLQSLMVPEKIERG